jgi:hypothetical protein
LTKSVFIADNAHKGPEFHYGYGRETLDAVTYNFPAGAELNFMIVATTSGCIPVVEVAYGTVSAGRKCDGVYLFSINLLFSDVPVRGAGWRLGVRKNNRLKV